MYSSVLCDGKIAMGFDVVVYTIKVNSVHQSLTHVHRAQANYIATYTLANHTERCQVV